MKVAQAAATKAFNNAKTAAEQKTKLEANSSQIGGRNRDEVGVMTRLLRQQNASDTTGTKSLAAAFDQLKSYNANAD